MNICQRCGYNNPDRMLYCQRCGTQLTSYQMGFKPFKRMTFGKAIKICMKEKFATFSGRASRAEYWWFALFVMLIMIPFVTVSYILAFYLMYKNHADEAEIIKSAFIGFIPMFIVCAIFFIPSLSALVRRLHDTGRSGWWYLISFVPSVGGLVLFVFSLLESQHFTNEYGPEPEC